MPKKATHFLGVVDNPTHDVHLQFALLSTKTKDIYINIVVSWMTTKRQQTPYGIRSVILTMHTSQLRMQEV
jgi:hypothetical protein